jgi:hypothetical protein
MNSLIDRTRGGEWIGQSLFAQQAGELAGSIEAIVETSSVVYAATLIAKFYSNPPALPVVDDNYQKLRKRWLWQRLNWHVKWKRRNRQAFA